MSARTWQRPWTLADLVRDPSLLHAGDADETALAALASPTRRGLLKGAGGLFAVSALAACSRAPKEKILPYNRTPPELVPGVPTFYATTLEQEGYQAGVIAELNDGRPTKIEGNPDHPSSLGATLAREQAAIWQLYDPDRAKEVTQAGQPASFDHLSRWLAERAARGSGDGDGIALLVPPTSSRALIEAIARVRANLPKTAVHFYSAGSPRAMWEAGRLVFGTPAEMSPDLTAAKVVALFDADLFAEGTEAVAHGRAFAAGRTLAGTSAMNRLYCVDVALTTTSSVADHRLALRPQEIPTALFALAAALAKEGLALPDSIARAMAAHGAASPAIQMYMAPLARDLVKNRGAAVIAVGPAQPAAAHAVAALLNLALGAPMRARLPVIAEAGTASHDLAALTATMHAGNVDTLIVFGGNPAYASPAELGFAAAMSKVPNVVYLAPYADETAIATAAGANAAPVTSGARERWVVPAAHALEQWRDGCAFDGTWSIAQPVLAPLTSGRTPFDLLAPLAGTNALTSPHEWLQAQVGSGRPWAEALTRGVVRGAANSAPPLTTARPDLAAIAAAIAALPSYAEPHGLSLSLPFDPYVRDGQMTNCPWLLELPHPTDKTTWGNYACLAASTARDLGVTDGAVVRIAAGGKSVEAIARVTIGMPANVVSLALGYGRQGGESIARNVGTNAFALASALHPHWIADVTLEITGRRDVVAATQEHFTLEGRADEVVPEIGLADLASGKADLSDKRTKSETLYAVRPGAARQWGMTIDLNACTGCQTCVLACQVENNIPTVGKAGVAKGREMHWLRIDRYVSSAPPASSGTGGSDEDAPDGPIDANPIVSVQPMLCQHCEKAPCEYVCPVEATSHSSEGLNQMTYNRCVGTRFCSNNCPYKVRRFNWFDYHDDEPELLRLGRNPDVTVRDRGVMEKCTFCVQRIRGAQQKAEVEGRDERTDEFTSACAQACPTRAITFGNIADPKSAVSQRWNEPRAYAVLHDLGTDPRVRYLARVRNPNPEMPRS